MKKLLILSTAAVAAMAAVSCQKENTEALQDGSASTEKLVITACYPQTKVSFEETESHNLKGSWELNDEILAVVEGKSAISFTVESVDDATGVATLATDASISDGDKVYAVYCPGTDIKDIKDGELKIDLSFQAADEIPALMVATASVASGLLRLEFVNCLSIIGIVDPRMQVKVDGRTMQRAIVSGHEVVSSGKVAVVDGSFAFVPGAPDKFIYKSLVGREIIEVESEIGTFEEPVYIAVPACKVEKITMLDSKNYIRAYEVNEVNQDLTTGKYARIYQKTFSTISLPTVALKVGTPTTAWADKNLGAETASKSGTNTWGDLYRWSDGGVIYTERTQKSVTFDADHSSGYASPSSGEIYYDGKAYTKYTSTDKKNVLDPVDDIVQLTYPGSGWRMPTVEDFNALNEYGNQSFATAGWVKIGPNAELYIPRTYVSNKGTAFKQNGRYWTASIDLTDNNNKPTYFEIGTSALTTGKQYRYYGFSIRPVRTLNSN